VGGSTIYLGDSVALSSSGDALNITNSLGTLPFISTAPNPASVGGNYTTLLNPPSILPNTRGISMSDNGQYITRISAIPASATTPSIYVSNNNGTSWTTVTTYGSSTAFSNTTFSCVAVSSTGQYQVVAQGNADDESNMVGYIFYSSNYGLTWAKKYDTPRLFTSIGISSDGDKIVATCLSSSAAFTAQITNDSSTMAISSITSGGGRICPGMIVSFTPTDPPAPGFSPLIVSQQTGITGFTGNYAIFVPAVESYTGLATGNIGAGFVYCTDASTNALPTFTFVNQHNGNAFEETRNAILYSDGTGFIITDWDIAAYSIVCYNFLLDPPLWVADITQDLTEGITFNQNTVVSNLNSAGFTVVYEYNDIMNQTYRYRAITYDWTTSAIAPTANPFSLIYSSVSPSPSINSLQIVTSADGVTLLYLPAFTASSDGCYISLDGGASWTKRVNSTNGITTSSTNQVAFILMEATTDIIYAVVKDTNENPDVIQIYKSVPTDQNVFYAPYVPSNPSEWPTAFVPTTVGAALNTIASYLFKYQESSQWTDLN
jgi:hypothetical protein